MSILGRSPTSSLFPIYLLPSIPFRRKPINGPTNAINAESSNSAHHATPDRYLNGHTSYLRCARCATDLCRSSQIISKGFTGRHGKAYLVNFDRTRGASSLPNTHTHPPVPRQLVTGAHTVSDVSCIFCGSVIGWKYESAEDESQRYKVGKYILETKKTFSSPCWENDGDPGGVGLDISLDTPHIESKRTADANVEFDSQDEDECEDLFAGLWSRALALKRRRGKRFGHAIESLDAVSRL